MKLFVLGATGKTGAWILEQALARGHEVTAFVRSPDKITRRDERLIVRAGDPTQEGDIAAALAATKYDVVLSVIGAPNLGPTTIHGDCAKATVAAMKTSGPRRLVVLSSSFLFEELPLFARIIRRLFFMNIVRDHRVMESHVIGSGLDYVIVRPPRLLPGGPRAQYETRDDAPAGKSSIRFSDVAHFMIEEAEKNQHKGHAVGLADR